MLKKKKKPVDMSFDITGDTLPRKKKRVVEPEPVVKKKRRADPLEEEFDLPPPRKKKRRVEHVEAEPVEAPLRRKKKRPGTELTVGPQMELIAPSGKKLSKINKKEMLSIIGDDAEEMQQLFEDGDTEAATKMLNRRLIQMCIDLIPQLETGIRNSNGRYGVHSLNGTIQTIRELVIDLQSAQDRGALGHSIVDTILKPAFFELATELVKEAATVLSDTKEYMSEDVYSKVKHAQTDSRNRLAALFNSKFVEVRDATISFLQR